MNPEALASVVQELRREAGTLQVIIAQLSPLSVFFWGGGGIKLQALISFRWWVEWIANIFTHTGVIGKLPPPTPHLSQRLALSER